MTLSGDYDDIRALIYELETSPDFFVIDNMALSEGGDANAPLTLASKCPRTSARRGRPQARRNGR